MTRATIKEIISAYTKGDIPQQVKDNFEEWMLEPDDFGEKNSAIEEIWNEQPETGDIQLPSAQSVLGKAKALESKSSGIMPADKKRNALLWITSIAAALLAILSVTLLLRGGDSMTCLASSEWSKGEFYLPDSTQVVLNMGSRLYYPSKFKGGKRQVRLEGEGYFNVAKDASRPFIVKARDLDIQVFGTKFNVSAYDTEKVSTQLLEGSIGISGPGLKQNVRLAPDQALIYDGNTDTYKIESVRAINHTLWICEKIEFEQASLFDICETVSHWYNMEIACDDEDFARDCHLTLTIRREPLYEILDAISEIVPISVSAENPKHITIRH